LNNASCHRDSVLHTQALVATLPTNRRPLLLLLGIFLFFFLSLSLFLSPSLSLSLSLRAYKSKAPSAAAGCLSLTHTLSLFFLSSSLSVCFSHFLSLSLSLQIQGPFCCCWVSHNNFCLSFLLSFSFSLSRSLSRSLCFFSSLSLPLSAYIFKAPSAAAVFLSDTCTLFVSLSSERKHDRERKVRNPFNTQPFLRKGDF